MRERRVCSPGWWVRTVATAAEPACSGDRRERWFPQRGRAAASSTARASLAGAGDTRYVMRYVSVDLVIAASPPAPALGLVGTHHSASGRRHS
jgi:hypothetical protein